MKAILLHEFGGVDKLQYTELPVPAIQSHEVLVQVKAISINPVDAKTRAGKGMAGRIKDKLPVILGWDISGIVTQVGSGVTQLKEGDAVFGMVNFPGVGNAYAEYVAAPADYLALKPANISHQEAAAATLAALTAWEIVEALDLQPADTFLVHAAAGGVGHYAVQLAKHIGAYVIGTASAANKDFVLGLGTDEFIDYKAQPLEEVISGVDKVLDNLGGENIDLSLKLMKPGGTLLSLPSANNESVKEKAAAKGMKGISLLVHSSGSNQQKIADWLADGTLKSHVSKTYSFDQMPEAHLQIESGRTVGKLAITV